MVIWRDDRQGVKIILGLRVPILYSFSLSVLILYFLLNN